MLRIDLSIPPALWYPAELPTEHGTSEVLIRFALLDTDEAAVASAQRLRLMRAVATSDFDAAYAAMLEALDPAEIATLREVLGRHILDWEIEDATTQKRLPVTEQTLAAVLGRAAWLRPIWSALIDASTGPGLKKTAPTGSTGGSTTSSPQPPDAAPATPA